MYPSLSLRLNHPLLSPLPPFLSSSFSLSLLSLPSPYPPLSPSPILIPALGYPYYDSSGVCMPITIILIIYLFLQP